MPGMDPKEAREQLDDLEELLHRGTLLTRQLLLFSRREEPRAERCNLDGSARFLQKPVDVARLAREVQAALA